MRLETIGKQVRKLRKERGWSREYLAEKVNISVNFLGQFERGEKSVRLETFIAIANALQVSADTLLQDIVEQSSISKCGMLEEKLRSLTGGDREKMLEILQIIETLLQISPL